MGGRLRKGLTIIGGVVTSDVKSFFDSLVATGEFESRSKAIGHVLTEFVKSHLN